MRQFLLLSFLSLLFSTAILAQVPQEFSFQAVATDDSGAELVSQAITVRASVLQGTASGTALWTERFDVSTDEFGLFTVNIGSGIPLGGTLSTFSDIPWGEDYFFLSIDMDPEGGNDYAFIGSKQLLSVPYALYAKEAEFANAAGVADTAAVAGTASDDMDRSPSNEIQDILLNGTELSLTGSGVSVDIDTQKMKCKILNSLERN